ncbi:MAG: hypothetical protein ACI91B_002997 [Planctomycetota bacterium]|jgi:hypothetical protein
MERQAIQRGTAWQHNLRINAPQVDQAVRQQIAVRQDGQATHACDQAWPYGGPCGDGITRRSPRRQPSARQPPTY